MRLGGGLFGTARAAYAKFDMCVVLCYILRFKVFVALCLNMVTITRTERNYTVME